MLDAEGPEVQPFAAKFVQMFACVMQHVASSLPPEMSTLFIFVLLSILSVT